MNPATFNSALESTEELLELLRKEGNLSRKDSDRCTDLYSSMPVDFRKDMLIRLFKNEI